MKKIITLFSIILSVQYSYAQDNWNAVKVFELDLDGNNVCYMYIDTVEAMDGGVVFCFQTSDNKIIKTDAQGNIIDRTEALYHFDFAIYNGDTLYIDIPGCVINATSGDTIYQSLSYIPISIAASPYGIYLYLIREGRRCGHRVSNILNKTTIYEFDHMYDSYSMYCSEGILYILQSPDDDKSVLTYFKEDLSYRNQVTIQYYNLTEIAVYRGLIYAYSDIDKAVYRLEPSNETGIDSIIRKDNLKEPVHYGLEGIKTDSSTPGIHIVRNPDGSVRKSIVTK